ncbi:MAG: hypothetical protein Q7T53_08555 [Deltaproteobacteria bacterium]|nr:hypothetical protein [Deltaproteobacteria bacterium]
MKKLIAISGLLVIVVGFAGCYKQLHLEKTVVPAELRVVALDAPAPSQDEADLIIATHIKKASYLLSPRTAYAPYTFTLMIDGQRIKEDAKGVEEVESDMKEEKGKGIHYTLEKRFRLKPGHHELAVKTDYGKSPKVRIELMGGRIHTLKFEPVYGPRKVGLKKTFQQGLVDYKVYLDGSEIK